MRENPECRQELLALFPRAARKVLAQAPDGFLRDERTVLADTRGYPINPDWKPVSEYYLGLGLRRWIARR
jgi:hypothetical protein